MKIKINQISLINKAFTVKEVFPCIFIFIISIMFVFPGQGYGTKTADSKNKDIKTIKDPENSILHTPFVTKKTGEETALLSVVTANELKTKLEVVEKKLDYLSDTMRFYHYGFIFLIIFAFVELGVLILLIVILRIGPGKIMYSKERPLQEQKNEQMSSQRFLKDKNHDSTKVKIIEGKKE